MEDNFVDSVIDGLWPSRRESVFVLLDAARDQRIFEMLQRSRLDYRCLFIGKLAPELARVAPYLVHLGSLSKETRQIIAEGWGNAWGVFVRAEVLLQELWRHFRGMLQVQDERGRQMLFRFYDPRVLRLYLPTCTPKELKRVFGPVDRFFLEDNSGQLLELENRDGVMDESRFTVPKTEAEPQPFPQVDSKSRKQ